MRDTGIPFWAQERERRMGWSHDAPTGEAGFANAVRALGDDWRSYIVRNSVTTYAFEAEARTPDENDRIVNRLCMPERNQIDWFHWRSK